MAAQVVSPGQIVEAEVAPKPQQEEWKENLNLQMICPDCKEKPPNLVEEFSSGDMVCASCGLVLGARIIDTRSEWRTFSNDDQGNDDPSRVGEGANPLLNGSQLQTSVSFGDGIKSRELARAQNKSNHDKSTKSLLTAYKEIGAYCDSIGIQTNVTDTVKYLFKMVHDSGSFKGKNQDTLIAGCIFIACRQCKVPRTFREIFALTKVTKAEIGRVFKSLDKFFSQQNKEKMANVANPGAENYTATSSTDAKELCIRFCSQLQLPSRCTTLSQDLAAKMQSGGSLAGRSPLSVAAACIYMASYLLGTGKSAKEISTVAGVSDGTIRTAYKLIYPERESLVDAKWLEGGKVDLKRLPAA